MYIIDVLFNLIFRINILTAHMNFGLLVQCAYNFFNLIFLFILNNKLLYIINSIQIIHKSLNLKVLGHQLAI